MHLPRTSKFSTEVFITKCNVDWGSEKVFAGCMDPAGVVLDVGANVGYYSLYVLPCVSAVYAFEPDPRAKAMLQQNLAGHANAHLYGLAVGAKSGRAKFILEGSSEISHLANSLVKQDENFQEIDITTIDHFVSDRNLFVTGIKIDAEGADLDVIEGSLKILGSQFPLVLAETKPEIHLFDLISPLGYKVFAFVKHPKTARFEFREIDENSEAQTKMLFLVPARLHSTFAQLVS